MRRLGFGVLFSLMLLHASAVNSAPPISGGQLVIYYWYTDTFQVDTATDPPGVDGNGDPIPVTATYTLSKAPTSDSILLASFASSQVGGNSASSYKIGSGTPTERKTVNVTLPNYRPFIDGEDIYTFSYFSLEQP